MFGPGWIRFWPRGPGFNLLPPSHRPLFSERTGAKKPVVKIGGYRLFWLKGYAGS